MLDASAAKSFPCGTFSSSTMMVMMMAMTPSVKASSRPLVIVALRPDAASIRRPRRCPHPTRARSFRGARLRANPESGLQCWRRGRLDTGFALRAPRNDRAELSVVKLRSACQAAAFAGQRGEARQTIDDPGGSHGSCQAGIGGDRRGRRPLAGPRSRWRRRSREDPVVLCGADLELGVDAGGEEGAGE